MQLTDLQKQIMKLWADKSLSFGCVVSNKERWKVTYHKVISYHVKENWEFDAICDWYIVNDLCDENIIWHPIRYDRLCYLRFQKFLSDEQEKLWLQIEHSFIDDVCLYNQSILEWNEQTQLLVRDFLLSIQ